MSFEIEILKLPGKKCVGNTCGPLGGPPEAVEVPRRDVVGWGGPISRGAISGGASFRGGPPYNLLCYNFRIKLLSLWSKFFLITTCSLFNFIEIKDWKYYNKLWANKQWSNLYIISKFCKMFRSQDLTADSNNHKNIERAFAFARVILYQVKRMKKWHVGNFNTWYYNVKWVGVEFCGKLKWIHKI